MLRELADSRFSVRATRDYSRSVFFKSARRFVIFATRTVVDNVQLHASRVRGSDLRTGR